MKNASIILNVILVAAVAFLYYHSFSGKKKTDIKPAAQAVKVDGQDVPVVCRIAYFNMDSVENSFSYYLSSKASFDALKEQNNSYLDGLLKKYNSRLAELQQKATTQADMERARAELDEMMRKNQEEKANVENKLYNAGSRLNEDILKKISDYLKEYNTPKQYDYIIQYEPRLMFYKDSTLNITTDLIKGLNEKYKKTRS